MLCAPKMRSVDDLNMLSDQIFPSVDLFFPDGMGIFQNDNARIYWAQTVKKR